MSLYSPIFKAIQAMEKRIPKATELPELLGHRRQRFRRIFRGIQLYAQIRDRF